MPKEVHNALTPARVRQEKTPGRYADGLGLYLHVAESGARWWIWRGVIRGRQSRVERGIGSARLVTLAEAREIARQWRRAARDGIDPATIRDQARRSVVTFEEAARQVWRDQVEPHMKKPKDAARWLQTLVVYAFPTLGTRPVHAIVQADVLRVLAPIWTEKPETARRVRQRIRTVFDWARAAGHCEGVNPVEGVEKGLPRQRDRVQHWRALPYAELPALLRRIEAVEGMGALALRFAILTAARSGEVRGATWAEIDRDTRTWTIPAGRMKAQREHRIPLSDAALAVLDEVQGLSSGLAFPSTHGEKPLSDMTLAAVLKRLDVPVTVHGFRSTFRNWCEELTGFSREVKEAALAHAVRDPTEAAYRRTDLFDQRRALMDQWARFCLSGEDAGAVVELRR